VNRIATFLLKLVIRTKGLIPQLEEVKYLMLRMHLFHDGVVKLASVNQFTAGYLKRENRQPFLNQLIKIYIYGP
jgi:hypothetical protein